MRTKRIYLTGFDTDRGAIYGASAPHIAEGGVVMGQVLLKIKDMETGEIVHTVGPVSEHKSERVLRGMLINLNRKKYCVVEEKV